MILSPFSYSSYFISYKCLLFLGIKSGFGLAPNPYLGALGIGVKNLGKLSETMDNPYNIKITIDYSKERPNSSTG